MPQFTQDTCRVLCYNIIIPYNSASIDPGYLQGLDGYCNRTRTATQASVKYEVSAWSLFLFLCLFFFFLGGGGGGGRTDTDFWKILRV